MRGTWWPLPAACLVLSGACDEHFPDPIVHGTVAPPVDDAGADADVDAGVPVTVTMHAPALDVGAMGAPASVTWAAYADDAGWHPLAAAAPGSYTFRVASARWSVALVCAAPSNAEVVIASRSSAVHTLDLQASGLCTPIPPTSFHDLPGAITHAPPTTGVLEFGYGNGAGSKPLTVDGDGAGTYVLFGVQDGVADLAFGTRDTADGPLTKMTFLRSKTTNGSAVDVDFAGGFVPGHGSVTVTALDQTETLEGQIRYTTGGRALGITLTPATLGTTFEYATIPATARTNGDLYRFSVGAVSDDGARRVDGTFADPTDLALTLPPPLDTPIHHIVKEPYQRIETTIPFVPPIALTTIDAVSNPSTSSRYRWVTTTDLSSALDVTMPNLTVVPGFDPAWALPHGSSIKVLVTREEPAETVSGGTRVRSSSRVAVLSGE